jgi:cytochrome c5
MRKSWLVIGFFSIVSAMHGQKLPDGKGKEIIEAACDGCHGVDQIIGRAWSAEKWNEVVKKMVEKGAVLSDEEFKTVIAYLVANFGDSSAKPKQP